MENEEKITIKQVFVNNRKIRIIGLLTLCTWLCFGVQAFGKYISYGKDGTDFAQVLSLTNGGKQWEETLKGNGYFLGTEKELNNVLEQLEQDCNVTIKQQKEREYVIEENEKLLGKIKVEPYEQKFLIQLEMRTQKQGTGLYSHKIRIDKRMNKAGVRQWQSYYDISFLLNSNLTKNEQKKMTEKIFKMFAAKLAFSCDLDGILCWYGNSGILQKGVCTNGEDINVQIAFSNEEGKQRTRCYIGTPILNGEY